MKLTPAAPHLFSPRERAFFLFTSSAVVGINRLDDPVVVVEEFCHFDVAQVSEPSRELAVVVKQKPLAFPLDDRVVGRPSQHRGENDATVSKRSVGRIRRGVDDGVRVTGRIGQVIATAIFMDPRAFKKSARIVASLELLNFIATQRIWLKSTSGKQC